MPSTDLSSQKWELRGSLNLNRFTKSGAIQIPGTYQNSLLKVEVKLRGLRNSWNQLGYLHQTHAGATHPKGHYLSVHDQLLQLANLSPYRVFIQLVPWVIREAQSGRLTGYLRFYESGTKLTNADLSNLDSFHRQQMSLVNPISIQFPPELDHSTKFTRPIAASLVAGESYAVAPVNDNRTGLVMRNPGAFDVYICLAATASAASAIAVLEPNGYYELSPADYNGAVSVICPAGAGSIAGSELASAQFSSGGASGQEYLVPGTTYTYRLNNGSIGFKDGDGAYVAIVGMNGVSQAYLLNGQVHSLSGSDPSVPGSVMSAFVGATTASVSNSGNWASVIADSNKVSL